MALARDREPGSHYVVALPELQCGEGYVTGQDKDTHAHGHGGGE